VETRNTRWIDDVNAGKANRTGSVFKFADYGFLQAISRLASIDIYEFNVTSTHY